MPGKSTCIVSFLLAVCLLLGPAGAWAAEDGAKAAEPGQKKISTTETGTPLEGLFVSYWPEYDEPSVLIIYRGKVDASIKTPATVKIAIPKDSGAGLVAVASINSKNEFEYDKPWKSKQLVDKDNMTILTFETAYPDFQFEMYVQKVSGAGRRDFDFSLPSISDIKMLNVEIKRPAGAEKFKAVPAAARVTPEGQFENHHYSYAGVVPGVEYSFDVSYDRADSKPSVDKQTGPAEPAATAGGGSQSGLVLILAVGLFGLGIGAAVWRAQAVASAPKTRPRRAAAKNFCTECGAASAGGGKFCHDCGAAL